MKHLINFESYMSNINEGINFNGAEDADLREIGELFANGNDPDNHDEESLIRMGADALAAAKPIALTGKIKADGPQLIKFVVEAFSRAGIELDDKGARIIKDMDGTLNQIEIPVESAPDFFFATSLDYYEMAMGVNSLNNGIEVGGCFSSEADGMLEFFVSNLSDNGQIVKAVAEFNELLKLKKTSSK